MRPVVLIPGIGGSILVQKGNEFRRLFHKSVPDNRWVNIYVATKVGLQNWKRDMQCTLRHNHDGRLIGIKPAHPLTSFDFGGTKGVKDIIPEFMLFPQQYQTILEELFHHRYFHFLADALHGVGYEDHVSVFGAPYDFRFILDPSIRTHYFDQLRYLFEKKCAMRGEKTVVVTHSLGGIIFKWFLGECVSQDWIDQHIEHWVCISAPFGGSYNAVCAASSGEHYIASMRSQVQSELQKNSGIIACLPNDLAFHVDEPLVHLGSDDVSTITLGMYKTLGDDGALPFKIWEDLFKEHLDNVIKPPLRVSTTIVCATRKASTPGVAYSEKWDAVPYHTDMCEGDGIVPLRSLMSAEKILDRKHVVENIYQGLDHTTLLSDPRVIKLVKKHACFKSPESI